MLKLILKVVAFLVILLILVLSVPLPDRSKYTGLKEDCFYHAIWLHDRIFLNRKPVDVAFLGSSHTINGIDDALIEHSLDSLKLSVVNLGYCRYGENLYYVLMKELLKMKKPRIIFLEIREDEDRYSHPVFPYLAEPADVWMAWPWFNRDLVSDDAVSVRYRIQMIRQHFLATDTVFPPRKEDFGFASPADTVSPFVLDEVRMKRKDRKWTLNAFERDFYMAFPRAYIRKIARLCESQHVKLVFLYLPEYASGLWEPLEAGTYRQYGSILIPPREIFETKQYWGDDSHLNQAGARQLSDWIAWVIKNK